MDLTRIESRVEHLVPAHQERLATALSDLQEFCTRASSLCYDELMIRVESILAQTIALLSEDSFAD